MLVVICYRWNGDLNAVIALLEIDANLDVKKDDRWTSSYSVACLDYLDIVHVLLAAGTNIDEKHTQLCQQPERR